jgi:hypothetical protein
MEASNQNENANSELGENINNKHTQWKMNVKNI